MKYSELKQALKTHKLRVTDCRMDVLEMFVSHEKALSMKEVEDVLTEYDRVTIYRTLNSFTDHGLLHRIPGESGYATFGLCHLTCSPQEHSHSHLHFRCEQCKSVECVDHDIPTFKLPGYQVNETQLILNGICKKCLLER